MRRIIYLLLVVAMMTTTVTPASAGSNHIVSGGTTECVYWSWHRLNNDVVTAETNLYTGLCTKVKVEANIKVDGAWTIVRDTRWTGYVYVWAGYDLFNWTRHTVWSSDLSSKSVWKMY
ncbi:hypothetical protein MNBD_ACTINO02-3065 [hydrothermal vent metagenome]|uniref:Uncharacterized protein n=1 Tax=hydrothermal vent metagenome TaxID=652676 RepID=A0A3B0SLK1_9ZZZZ